MKKIFLISCIAACVGLFSSCEGFLTENPADVLPGSEAFNTAADFEHIMNGVYWSLGTHRFLGRNVLAVGDVSSDLSTHSAITNHFLNTFNYIILDSDIFLNEIWEFGYRTINGAARIIQAGANPPAHFTEHDMAIVHTQMAQAYAVRALVTFYLTNIFGLPYSDVNRSTLGVVNVTAPVAPFERVERATVAENYAHILSDIARAKEVFAKPGVRNLSQAFMNRTAVYALEARVKLYMQDYEGAIAAANQAIALRGGSIVTTAEAYEAMFRTLAISSEDIFFIAKAEDDHLSANSLTTLYNSYGVGISNLVFDKLSPNDIRLPLLSTIHTAGMGGKMSGIHANPQVANVPILRLPEQYLILAEAYALRETPDFARARENLLVVAASRNPDLDVTTIPESIDIMSYIILERKLELVQEGHRFFDLRRWGLTANVSNGGFTDFAIYRFVFPIPVSEINAGFGVVQTEGWHNNLPH